VICTPEDLLLLFFAACLLGVLLALLGVAAIRFVDFYSVFRDHQKGPPP